jgi:AcrR family transcriptional regulator
MMIDMKTTPRSYTMRTRAEQAGRTRDRILDAVIDLVAERPLAACTLPAIADRADVSVQTILRAFVSRDGLFEAALERGSAQVLAERRADPDDVDGSLESLIDHYEKLGDGVVLLLGQESWEPFAAQVTTNGRRLHRVWVESVFARSLEAAPRAAREQLVDLLVVATDVYAWKLLRRDRGLSRNQTTERVRRLVASACESARNPAGRT